MQVLKMKPKKEWALWGLVCGLVAVSGLAVAGAAPKTSIAVSEDDAKVSKVDAKEEAARLALPAMRVNQYATTLGELESALALQRPNARTDMKDPAQRREFLEKWIHTDLLASEAVARGYDAHSEIQVVRRNQLANLMQRHIAERFRDLVPTAEELQAYYDAHIENYVKPTKVRARHIQLSNRAEAQKLLDDLRARSASQYEFRSVAQERSQDVYTRNSGGDLAFFPLPAHRQKGDPEVHEKIAKAAFDIPENGGIYPALVETDKGYHIVMRTGFRQAMTLTFAQAKERLVPVVTRNLQQSRIDAAIDAIGERVKVERHEENLKYVLIDLTETGESAEQGLRHPTGPLPGNR